MKINVEIVSLTFPAEAADGCSPSPTLYFGRSSVAVIEPYSDQRHWWLWDIIASKALWHLLFLADLRPQPVSTQHIFSLRTGRVCVLGFLFLKAAVTSPVTARRHEAEASAKEPRKTAVPVRPQAVPVGELSIPLEDTEESEGLEGCSGKATAQPPPASLSHHM